MAPKANGRLTKSVPRPRPIAKETDVTDPEPSKPGAAVWFDLTVPEVRRIDEEQWRELAGKEQSVAIDAEGLQMVASVIL